jgi:hypothetical protein
MAADSRQNANTIPDRLSTTKGPLPASTVYPLTR